MPAVGAWLATAAFPTLFGSVITYGTLLKTALVVGVGIYSRRQQKKARAAALDSIRDRTFMVRSAVTTRPIVYGRTRLSGPFRPVGTHGTDGEMFSFTVSLAGQLDAVEAVWFNDASIGTLDGSGWTTEGDYYYYKSRSEPAVRQAAISAGGTVTLDHLATSFLAVKVPIGDSSFGNLYAGSPSTDEDAYSVATVGGVSVLTFNSSRIGQTVTINYYYTTGEAKARALAFLGQSGQAADPYLIAQFPTTWSADHRSDGASYLSCTLVYDPDVFPTGVPNVSAVVRGKRIYDPRSGLTVWSQNPALIARDYLIAEFGCASSEIDDASVIVAANACDELVNYHAIAVQARYTFDGALDSGTNRLQNLETILASMAGTAVFSAGKWVIKAGVWETPTLALDEDDLAGDGAITIQAFQARRDLFNGVRGVYTDPGTWQQTDFPAYTSATYLAQDGDDEAILDVELPMVTDVYRAQRLAKLALFRARQALTFSASWNLGAYEVTPGDMVEITIGRYGWTDKAFRCIDREYDPSGGVRLTFQEDAEALYAWDYDEATIPDPAPNTTLPSVRTVAAPTLTWGSGIQYAMVLADGSVRPFLRVYWAEMDATVERIEILWRRAYETVWQRAVVDIYEDAYDIYGVAGSETMIVQARAINGLGVTSPWSAYAITIDTTAPANAGSVTLGVGVNLLPNSGFANSTTGFSAYFVSGGASISDFPSTITDSGSQFLVGRTFDSGSFFPSRRPIPTNAVMIQQISGASGVQSAVYSTSRIAVQAGERIEMQARVGVVSASAQLYALMYDSAGNQTRATLTGVIKVERTEGYGGSQTLDDFKLLYAFFDVPTGVVQVAFEVVKTREVATGSSQAVVAMPYIGRAHDGQTLPSAWSVGPSGGAIEGLDSIDDVTIEKVAGPVACEVYSLPQTTYIVSKTFTAGFDCVVELTGQVGKISGSTQTSGSDFSGLYVGAVLSDVDMPFGRSFTEVTMLGTDAGFGGIHTSQFGGVAVHTFQMYSGETVTFRLGVQLSPTHVSWSGPGDWKAENCSLRITAIRT